MGSLNYIFFRARNLCTSSKVIAGYRRIRMASNANRELREVNSRPSGTMEILQNVPPEEVSTKVDGYSKFYSGEKNSEEKVECRRESAKEMTSTYYDLMTDFYQYGWGDSFHFCAVYRGKSFRQCLLDHEHYLSDKMDLKAGMKVLVCACTLLQSLCSKTANRAFILQQCMIHVNAL